MKKIEMQLSNIQKEFLQKPCPHCGTGKLHAVYGDHAVSLENYLWCDTCDVSIDSDGGYIA